jgi:hypothetical protein
LGRPLIVLAGCDDNLYLIEVGATPAADQLAGRQPGGVVERSRRLGLVPPWATRDLVDVDAVGSTIVLALDREPPLLVSHDAGMTWNERGEGLPRARAVAVRENPDHLLYGGADRLYVSGDGGISWRVLAVDLPEIRDVAWG